MEKLRFSSTRKKLIVKNTKKYGNGVFAGQDIRKGEIIHVLDGKKVTLGQIVDRILSGKEIEDDPLQVGRRTYIDLDALSRSFKNQYKKKTLVRGSFVCPKIRQTFES